jgi:Holliday junction resolvase RusA-like endonuclease
MMFRLNIKPLSLNSAYRGRRFSTPELNSFKQEVYYLSPKIIKIPKGKIAVKYVFGVSSKNCDGDNLIKCLQDAIADKYGFNDREIYKWEVEKVDVKKGCEFIEFEIKEV